MTTILLIILAIILLPLLVEIAAICGGLALIIGIVALAGFIVYSVFAAITLEGISVVLFLATLFGITYLTAIKYNVPMGLAAMRVFTVTLSVLCGLMTII